MRFTELELDREELLETFEEQKKLFALQLAALEKETNDPILKGYFLQESLQAYERITENLIAAIDKRIIEAQELETDIAADKENLIVITSKAAEAHESLARTILENSSQQKEEREKLDNILEKLESAEIKLHESLQDRNKFLAAYEERYDSLMDETEESKKEILEIFEKIRLKNEEQLRLEEEAKKPFGLNLSYIQADEISDNLEQKAAEQKVDSANLKLYHLQVKNSDQEKIEVGTKFSFSTTNQNISQAGDEKVGESYNKIVKTILQDSLTQYNDLPDKKGAVITQEDVAKFILLAEKYDGIGNVVQGTDKAARNKLGEDFQKLFPKKASQYIKAAIDFSRIFQENCADNTGNAQLYTGNEDCKKLVGLRLKRVNPLIALENSNSRDEFLTTYKTISGKEFSQENIADLFNLNSDLGKTSPIKSPLHPEGDSLKKDSRERD